jgi:hypothetical protein
MYGKPVKELTIDEILSRVSEWDLWSYYIPGVQLKKKFKSPLRKDEEPSASLFVNRQNSILFKDFGTGQTMNIWSFLQARYNVTFREVLLLVNNDFNLKLACRAFKVKPSMELFGVATNRVVEQRAPSVIKIKKRAWSLKDKEYWGQYGLTSSFLDSRNVKPIQNYWVNDHLVYWHSDYNPAYSYEFERGKRKVYSPFAKKFKFLTNAGDKVVQGLAYLPETGESLIITKSYKDVLVLQSLGYHSIAPQSESMTIDSALIDNLKTRFKYIYLLYDNDATGKKYSKKLCEQYRLMPIFVPEPVKDISDYRKTYGIVKTLGLLKSLLDEDREREEVPESY